MGEYPNRSASQSACAYNPPIAVFWNNRLPDTLFESSMKYLSLMGCGKMRDIHAIDGRRISIITDERMMHGLNEKPLRKALHPI